ncbi:hypothetical protein MKW94_021495, partial [Papaver nudicaule]|nr:hypothetical protein [Papaver nudicaule]
MSPGTKVTGTEVSRYKSLPAQRSPDPWEHVLDMGLGAVFVNQLVKWDAQLQVDLDKMLDKAKAANERRYF